MLSEMKRDPANTAGMIVPRPQPRASSRRDTHGTRSGRNYSVPASSITVSQERQWTR